MMMRTKNAVGMSGKLCADDAVDRMEGWEVLAWEAVRVLG